MSALAIVAICVGVLLAYCALSVYVYLRLLWYLQSDGGYDPSFAAAIWTFFLPAGLMYLVVRSVSGADRNGIPPRAVRREQRAKAQRKEIERLERELELLS